MREALKLFLLTVMFSLTYSFSGLLDDYGRGKNNVPEATSGLTEDDALFLTPYIEKGQIEKGQNLAKVPTILKNIESFAGFITVNKSTDSNLFFWLFKSQQGDWKKKPLVIWLQGGPGGSSMFGLFTELGPFSVTKGQKLKRRKYSWHQKYNLVFIDNPVGAGFSFTKKDSGYATDERDVARDLYELLVQLYKLFPTLQSNKLFMTGESYAGKYIPAIAYKIHNENKASTFKINLAGLMIGNAFTDPLNLMTYSTYLYKLGLIDKATENDFKRREDEIRALIRSGQFISAASKWGWEMNEFEYLSGLRGLYDFVNDDIGNDGPEIYYINDPETRKNIHVGSYTFQNGYATYEHLQEDMFQSVRPWVEELLTAEEFPIMFYSGQLDIIVAYPLSLGFYDALEWPHASEYHKANRCQFKVGNDVAGYYKTAGTFTEVLVRNTGHMVPTTQPKWAFELLDRFITNSSSFVC
nr:PREDICTED: venom serine carboxypeptidase-like [Bemisia tabaci]